MKWIVRAFKENPGGAYDPAPIYEFDLMDEENEFVPAVGDYLRGDEAGTVYKVVSRYFDYGARRCAIKIEEVEITWLDE